MAYLNERRRVEYGMIVHLLSSVITDGVRPPVPPQIDKAISLLRCVLVDVSAGQEPEKLDAMANRRGRWEHAAFAPFRAPGAPVARFGISVFMMLNHLLEHTYFELGDASDMKAALDILLPALNEALEKDPAVDLETAIGVAQLMFIRSQKLGYFVGVPSKGELFGVAL